MTDEVQAATAVSDDAPKADAMQSVEKQLRDEIAFLQKSLAIEEDSGVASAAALQAAAAINDERAARGRALVDAFQHAMGNNAPLTLPMLAELKALVLPS